MPPASASQQHQELSMPSTSASQQHQQLSQEYSQFTIDNSILSLVGNQFVGHQFVAAPDNTIHDSSQTSNILLNAMSNANLATYNTVEVPVEVDMPVVEVSVERCIDNLEFRIGSLETTAEMINSIARWIRYSNS